MTKAFAKRAGGWASWFEAHPEFAALRPKFGAPAGINDEGGTIDFGRAKVTRRLIVVERPLNSYYARHRAAKGDTAEVAQDTVTVSGDGEWIRALADTSGRTDDDAELWQRCVALCHAAQRTAH